MLVPSKMVVPFPARRKLGDLLVPLANSTTTFHLAGSYYFGVAKTESDVDLYAQHSPALVAEIKALGFFPLSEPYYSGEPSSNTHTVYGHSSLPVHIQTFYNLALALKARDILSSTFNAEHARTRGSNRRQMWEAAEFAARQILSLATPA